MLDPIVTLTWAAAATRSIRLGVSVLLVPLYAPVVLAKQLASLDVVSGGRLTVGVGLGWSRDEWEAGGVGRARSGARADEFLKVLGAVWGDDPVEFAGEFYRVPRSRIAPKPVQRPRPTLLVGGTSDGAVRRAVTLADGYAGGNIPLAELGGVVTRVREAAARAGRDPAAVPIVCRGAYRLTDGPLGADRRSLHGSPAEIRADVERYAAAGVTELFFEPNFQPGGARLDRVLADLVALAPHGA